MITYKTILVPHGGTAAGDEALSHAISVAKCKSSKIVILHVIEPWSDPSFGYWIEQETTVKDQIDSIFSNLEEGGRKFLAERVSRCRKESLSCDGIFRVGKPSDSIIKYANEEKIDLIIIGKKKKIPNYKSMFKIGSVTKKVQEKVDCSILLVDTDDESE